jgi:hypothetical protein
VDEENGFPGMRVSKGIRVHTATLVPGNVIHWPYGLSKESWAEPSRSFLLRQQLRQQFPIFEIPYLLRGKSFMKYDMMGISALA